MSLPVVKYVRHTLTLPPEKNSEPREIQYRGFTTKEHKTILQAFESGDEKTVTNTVLDVINACTFNEIDFNTVPMYYIDFLYLHIHAKSVGDDSILSYVCNAKKEDGKTCNTKFNLKLHLPNVELANIDTFDSTLTVEITDTVGIKLRAPSFEVFRQFIDGSDVDLKSIDSKLVYKSIVCIYDGDSITAPGKDFTEEEFVAWYEPLDSHVSQQVVEWFDTFPYVAMALDVTCPGCGKVSPIILRGINDFFD